ncbi:MULTISPECIES: DddA-like double-stranded DNA deaminase toxin [Actinosynnema]|uniref:DddA-like double-stranded DNA deaminase toxin n=1 Tax=Actinosynnema TaxID=40566 RepID=UPI0020A4BC63|nr:DddA-like double-stranded DNA deaminase toxin [Actinosynnema pretiosum]MCP2093544.1 SCP1.201-like deaminase [Actinosynnema pretiosum]
MSESLLSGVWAQVAIALDRAASAALLLNRAFGLLCEAVDGLFVVARGSAGEVRGLVQWWAERAAEVAESLWRMQWSYLQAERSLLAYVARLGGVLPARSVTFPGHVEPDAHFGPNPERHHPALVEVPIVRAGRQEDRTSTWARRVQRGLPTYAKRDKTAGMFYNDSSQSWELLSGTDHRGGLTRKARQHISRMTSKGFFDDKPPTTKSHHSLKLTHASTHVEVKAAVWARDSGQSVVDVVINRRYVCGDDYDPTVPEKHPGCLQAVESILKHGQVMRVWRVGGAGEPVVIRGKGD